MTNNEVKQVLAQAEFLLNTMTQEHVKKLLQVFVGKLQENPKNVLFVPNFRKIVRKIISDFVNMPRAETLFTQKQIKQIYAILGDYDFYPVCRLCGKPIKIDTKSSLNTSGSKPGEFTWDHIYPKSCGGANVLSNLQPAHKICNNHKGCKVPDEQNELHQHYTLNINITIGSVNCVNHAKTRRKKKFQPSLRKQDSWCHKQRNRYCR